MFGNKCHSLTTSSVFWGKSVLFWCISFPFISSSGFKPAKPNACLNIFFKMKISNILINLVNIFPMQAVFSATFRLCRCAICSWPAFSILRLSTRNEMAPPCKNDVNNIIAIVVDIKVSIWGMTFGVTSLVNENAIPPRRPLTAIINWSFIPIGFFKSFTKAKDATLSK